MKNGSPGFEHVCPIDVYSEQRREKRSCIAVSLREREAALDSSLLAGSALGDDPALFTTRKREKESEFTNTENCLYQGSIRRKTVG